jgi:hypothetical protein
MELFILDCECEVKELSVLIESLHDFVRYPSITLHIEESLL